MEIALTEAATRHLVALAQAAQEAQARYHAALTAVCSQHEGLPEKYRVEPDWPNRRLAVTATD